TSRPTSRRLPTSPAGNDRYGFRVPAVVVSPYAQPHHVSHRVRDHTAILKFIETKWNIGALTYRDANADDLLDCLDFRHPPAFLGRAPGRAVGQGRGETLRTPG